MGCAQANTTWLPHSVMRMWLYHFSGFYLDTGGRNIQDMLHVSYLRKHDCSYACCLQTYPGLSGRLKLKDRQISRHTHWAYKHAHTHTHWAYTFPRLNQIFIKFREKVRKEWNIGSNINFCWWVSVRNPCSICLKGLALFISTKGNIQYSLPFYSKPWDLPTWTS